jgi:hypothetical protein
MGQADAGERAGEIRILAAAHEANRRTARGRDSTARSISRCTAASE